MPELGRHGEHRDSVSDRGHIEAFIFNLSIFKHVDKLVEATFVSKHVHKVYELLADACRNAWAGEDSFEPWQWLDVIVKLRVNFSLCSAFSLLSSST